MSWRFGAYLGKTPDKHQSTLGWAVVEVDHRKVILGGEMANLKDPIQSLIGQAFALEARFGTKPKGIELYRWNADNFHQSRACREGQTLEHHQQQQKEAARRIRAAGFRVIWRRPFDGRSDEGGGAVE